MLQDNEEDKSNRNKSDIKNIKKQKYKDNNSKNNDYSQNINSRNQLLKSIGGNNFENDNEEKIYLKDENINDEYDIDINNKKNQN